ncbi:MAG: sigma-70 family RNA polymerase sigma factor [Wenzhouxiangella sp.]|nr:MAG: sigma-70 family RNA polymerase sigma factor [Wenzhouxiangella sp.]
MTTPSELTGLLNAWVDGDSQAFDQIAPVIYQELRQIAGQVFSREYDQHTLQPTILVHEAYERLLGLNVTLTDREHFFALAARMMRRLLINHAMARKAAKRGGSAIQVTLYEHQVATTEDHDLFELDAALQKLAEYDPRKADVLELNYFGGLTQSAIARVLKISESTVRREQRVATLWLKKFMSESRAD